MVVPFVAAKWGFIPAAVSTTEFSGAKTAKAPRVIMALANL